MSTLAGTVSVAYHPDPLGNEITADVDLKLHNPPERLLVRFRHLQKRPICSVWIDDKSHSTFDAEKGDVELPPVSGKIRVRVTY